MSCPRVAVVIVHYGAADLCARCVESVRGSQGVSPALFIVDNNPRGSSVLEESSRSLGGNYLPRPENLGFAAGANLGIRAALGDPDLRLIAVLNPDVELAPDCLRALLEALEADPAVGVAGPAVLSASSPDTVWNCGSEIVWPQGKPRSVFHGRETSGLKEVLSREAVLDVDFVCGAVFALLPRNFEKIGPISESYFLYFEDADLSFRARRSGFRTVLVPRALAWHRGGASFEGLEMVASYYRARNRLHFSLSWNPCPLRGRLHRALFGIRTALRAMARYGTTRDSGEILPLLGVLDYLRGRSGKRARP